MIAAIVIADSGVRTAGSASSDGRTIPGNWACVEVLGQSVVGRVANGLKRSGIDAVFVFATPKASLNPDKADGQFASDHWKAAASRLAKCKEEAFEAVLITDATTYAEFDLADMLAFHDVQGSPVCRAYSADGPVDLWVIDPSRFNQSNESEELRSALVSVPACYGLNGYVNRLQGVHDLRRLIFDSFSSQSRLRPTGVETRPGVWIGEDVELGHNARIVPPAFIGRGVRIADECLITRGTNVERGSHIDFGTAVEDSSILPNTYLGIGLDLAHSIVDGRNLWNLQHDVTLEITDSAVMRPILARGDELQPWSEFRVESLSVSAQES